MAPADRAEASRDGGAPTLAPSALTWAGDDWRVAADAWDALAAGRGVHADVLAGGAWFGALAARPDAPGPARVVAAVDGQRPVAVVPLFAASNRRWTTPPPGLQARWRPALDSTVDPHVALAPIAEEIARRGVRDLLLDRMPTRDPATVALADALQAAGYDVRRREVGIDNLALVERGWEEVVARFGRYGRDLRKPFRYARRHWDVHVERYGPGPGADDGRDVLAGFEVYLDVHARSWKGPLDEATRVQRARLLAAASRRGWARVFVLRVAGVAAAADLSFRTGDVITGYSTAYDARLASLAPGNVLRWSVLESLYAERPDEPPRVIDHLPGTDGTKSKICVDTSPIVCVDATRARLFGLAVGSASRRAVDAARHRLRATRRRARSLEDASESTSCPAALVVEPDPAARPPRSLDVDDACRKYLVVAGGHRNTTAMLESWRDGDSWWRVGPAPDALVRVGDDGDGTRRVREMLVLDPGSGPPDQATVRRVLSGFSDPVLIDGSTTVRVAALPWPFAATAEPAAP